MEEVVHVVELKGHQVELDDFIYGRPDTLGVVKVDRANLKFFSLEIFIHMSQARVLKSKDVIGCQLLLFLFRKFSSVSHLELSDIDDMPFVEEVEWKFQLRQIIQLI